MRGEYPTHPSIPRPQSELPPHARRILVGAHRTMVVRGTTSACAENTPTMPRSAKPNRNYLRMRGEYGGSGCVPSPLGELPPHARRIPSSACPRSCPRGTTSACAENTNPCMTWVSINGNYLRMRGEYLICRGPCAQPGELPPHARRILIASMINEVNFGTTSACAENTWVGFR